MSRAATWSDNDVLWLLEAAELSRKWIAEPPVNGDLALMALCWEAARRDQYTARPSRQRRETLKRLSRHLCQAKIEQDVRPDGPGAPGRVPAPDEIPDVQTMLRNVERAYGADSIVVARAHAVSRAAGLPVPERAARRRGEELTRR